MARLLQMDHEAVKAAIDEYFFRVYFQNHEDQGLAQADVYDPQLLALLGLSPTRGLRRSSGAFAP
jgi:hypothetical protein